MGFCVSEPYCPHPGPAGGLPPKLDSDTRANTQASELKCDEVRQQQEVGKGAEQSLRCVLRMATFFFPSPFIPATPFSLKCLPRKVTPMGSLPPTPIPPHHLHSNPSQATAGRCSPRKIFCIIGGRGGGSGDAGKSTGLAAAAGKKSSSGWRDHATRRTESSGGDTGITKLKNRPPRLLPPPSPRSRAAA